MCIDDVVAGNHQCIKACPVCYLFTAESLVQLLSGGSIQLGIIDLFIEVAQAGCRFCQMLYSMWNIVEPSVSAAELHKILLS